jgi:hypothetical protein
MWYSRGNNCEMQLRFRAAHEEALLLCMTSDICVVSWKETPSCEQDCKSDSVCQIHGPPWQHMSVSNYQCTLCSALVLLSHSNSTCCPTTRHDKCAEAIIDVTKAVDKFNCLNLSFLQPVHPFERRSNHGSFTELPCVC